MIENSGTTIIDVTDPSNPVTVLMHLRPAAPSKPARARKRSAEVCICHHLLREVGSTAHEVLDVTVPERPVQVSLPLTGLTTTHKNYWDCEHGLAYLIGGAGASAAKPDGWTIGQHVKVVDLSDPADPKNNHRRWLPRPSGQLDPEDNGRPGARGVVAVSKLHAPEL